MLRKLEEAAERQRLLLSDDEEVKIPNDSFTWDM